MMPEMYFRVLWPDQSETVNYSPSLVIKDYFKPGDDVAMGDFLEKSRAALKIASDRVQEKYGMPCSRAKATLAAIEQRVAAFASRADAQVKILEFLE